MSGAGNQNRRPINNRDFPIINFRLFASVCDCTGYSSETEESGKTLRDYISGNYETTSCLKEQLLVSWCYKYSKLRGEMYQNTLVGSLGKRPSKTQDLVDGAVWKCTLRNFINCWTFRSQFELSAKPVLIFPTWCLQFSETKQNMKMACVVFAFLIKALQNADQKPIGSGPAYRVQCTLPPQPIYQALLFDFSRVWFRD